MKRGINIFFSLILVVIFLAIVFSFTLNKKGGGLSQKILKINEQRISAIIADTNEERITGLSRRQSLKENEGLLMVFEEPQIAGIWMKDMFFNIDRIWINQDKTVVDFRIDVSPNTYPEIFSPKSPALYVLEVPSGFVQKYGIKIGDRVVF